MSANKDNDEPSVVDFEDHRSNGLPRLKPGVITEAREQRRKEKIEDEFAASKIRKLLDKYAAPLKCSVREIVHIGTRSESVHRGTMDLNEGALENFDEDFSVQFGRGRYRLLFKYRGEYVTDHYLTVGDNYPKPGEREAQEEERRKREFSSPESMREMFRGLMIEMRPQQPPVDFNALATGNLQVVKAVAEALRPAQAPAQQFGFAEVLKLFELFKTTPGAAAAMNGATDPLAQFDRFIDIMNKTGVLGGGGGGGSSEDLSLGRAFLEKVLAPGITAFSTEAGKGMAPKIANAFFGGAEQPKQLPPSQPVPQQSPSTQTAQVPEGSKEMTREELKRALKEGAKFRQTAPSAGDSGGGEKK